MNLDASDLAILEVLREDGRASLRKIAARTSLSTPTVSLHLSRMEKGGLIKGYAPIIDPMSARQVLAFVRLKVPARSVERISRDLSRLEEVVGVFVTTGDENLVAKVSADDIESLQRFVGGRLAKHLDGEIVSNEIVTKVVKDVREAGLRRDAVLKLVCDYCRGEITGSRPYNIKVGQTYHYFCCRTCRRSFLQEHRKRIDIASSLARQNHLRS